MKFQVKITLHDGTTLTPTGKPSPRLSNSARKAIRASDQARARMDTASHYMILGGNNSPEALASRGYIYQNLHIIQIKMLECLQNGENKSNLISTINYIKLVIHYFHAS